ncbi:MAG: hypothetical protein M3Q29_25800 [Chloroflexota bacterium]|nr:hypothetical protein [Chloroflexota bacterium]
MNRQAQSGNKVESILAAILTPLALLVVAAVLPRSRDAWGMPPKER